MMNSPQAQYESEVELFDDHEEDLRYQKWLDEVNSQQQDYGRITDDFNNQQN